MRKKKYTDQEIVAAIRSGKSDGALQFLYHTTQRKISSYILKNNGSLEEAQDIFQDAVVALFHHVTQGKFEHGKSVDAFLFSVARNAWITRAKKLNKQVNQTASLAGKAQPAEENQFITQQAEKERHQKLDQMLNSIGEKCRELITLTVFYKLSMEEVAKRMGFSGANAAKTRNYKCKQKLIKLVKENHSLRENLMP